MPKRRRFTKVDPPPESFWQVRTTDDSNPGYLDRLRDQFAVAALQGLVNRGVNDLWSATKEGDTLHRAVEPWQVFAAKMAYAFADAAVNNRNRPIPVTMQFKPAKESTK